MNYGIIKFGKRCGFTIIEMLTVLSIIVILISLLVPSLGAAKRFAREVRQKAQFRAIGAGLDMFNGDELAYPDSGRYDPTGVEYCGAIKLCEAMVGQDLMGYHPASRFRDDFTNGADAIQLYDYDPYTMVPAVDPDENNIRSRELYMDAEHAGANRLEDIYGEAGGMTGLFRKDLFVLTDVYTRLTNRNPQNTGARQVGMPILYYKADDTKTRNDVVLANYASNVYDYTDNQDLVVLGMPDDSGLGSYPQHKMDTDYAEFYKMINNDRIGIQYGRPMYPDTYILQSAGYDGQYGTADDMFNFAK